MAKTTQRSRSRKAARRVLRPASRRSAVRGKSARPAAAAKPARAAAAPSSRKGKWVYVFGDGKAEGKAEMKNLLGGKGANLAEMANLGLPVPPGFTITTEVCTFFYANRKSYPKELKVQVEAALARVGKQTGKGFGDAKNPLLVSVRSGARASMPGMMDTVLNLGLNDTTVEAVTVNCPETELRQNRLRLLSDIRDSFLEVADFSAIEGTSDDGKHRDDKVGL